MKLRDEETSEERAYRQNILPNESKKTIPIIVVILIVLGVIFLLIAVTTKEFELGQYGLGDPYHCAECKDIGFSCKEHRGYSVDEAIKEEVERFCWDWIPKSKREDLSILDSEFTYGKGITFNPDCDFCNEAKEECYGCSYTRQRFEIIAEDILTESEFTNKLCAECWKLGFPNCSSCRIMLSREIVDRLSKKSSGEQITIFD